METKFTRFGMEHYKKGIVNDLLKFTRSSSHIFGSGISSFGPTIFGLTDSQKKAEGFLSEVKETFITNNFELMQCTKINGEGAKIKKIK